MADDFKYLICDVTGPYSRIEYGKKGDKVTFIKSDSEFSLVELNGDRFHARNINLSDTPIETEENKEAAPDTAVNNKVSKPVPVSRPKTSGKKAAPINKQQSTLF
jgi:hypothetical protein